MFQNKKNHEKGQAMVLTVTLFLMLSLTSILGLSNPILRHLRATYNISESKQSFYLAESGTEDMIYRLKEGWNAPASSSLSLGGYTATITTVDAFPGKTITSTGDYKEFVRKVQAKVLYGSGVSFHYGIQAGRGGFSMQNSSSVIGNVYSSGTVTGSGNYIYGDVISSGASGLVYGIHATGTIFAHSIGNSSETTYADKDAYYATSKINTVVTGTSYPGSTDQADAELPISDAQIAEWEDAAEAGGSVACSAGTYTISSNTTIGPKKIPCNLVISGSPTVTIAGHIWVTGNITIQNSSIVKMAASLGSQNVAIVADNPSNRLTSSIINVANTASFQDSGTPGSFVFLISQNNSAENGGSTAAVNLSNNTKSLVAYASHGLIPLANSVNLKEVTAYKITLQNSAQVTYDTGLPNTLFSAGPGGGYDISSWKEIE
jgi:hypothetical protein